jgi:lysozyme
MYYEREFAAAGGFLKQAQHFLDIVGNDPGTLLVLDFEPNPTGPSMDLEEARAFVTHINEERSRFPGFYSGHYIKQL